MSPDNGNFYSRLQARYEVSRKPVTTKQIKRQLNQPVPSPLEMNVGNHNNKADVARKRIFEFLSAESYRGWINGVEYDPEINNADITLYLEDATPQGDSLIDLIEYPFVSLHVGSSPSQIDKYVKTNLKKKENRLDWYKNRQVVLDGTLTENEVTSDLLFQMWILSDNLFVPNLAQDYISHFDDSTQLLLQTPHVMRPVIKRRRPIIEAFYKDECTTNFELDTRYILEQFSLT